MILDVAYVGNVVHNKFVQLDANGVAPYTTWTPSAGANPAYLDPTTGGKAFYTANLIRPTLGYGAINTTCSCGAANYNSLQTQVNRRFGKRLQFGANWTWSKTMSYTRGPWTPDSLSYAEVANSRPQVVNVNYSYRVPNGSRIWKNPVTKVLLDGWRFNGITKFLSGTPLTVNCTAQGAPIGYWTALPLAVSRSAARWMAVIHFFPPEARFRLPPRTGGMSRSTPPTSRFRRLRRWHRQHPTDVVPRARVPELRLQHVEGHTAGEGIPGTGVPCRSVQHVQPLQSRQSQHRALTELCNWREH